MSFKSVGTGHGGSGLTDLPAAVKQLQGFKQLIVDGAAANTNIAVTGLLTTSTIVAVQNLTDLATVTAAATIQAAGQMRIAADTSTKKLLVTFFI